MAREPEIEISQDGHPHERFEKLARTILAVPKAEVDKRDAKWQKRKRAKPESKRKR